MVIFTSLPINYLIHSGFSLAGNDNICIDFCLSVYKAIGYNSIITKLAQKSLSNHFGSGI